MNDRGTPIAWPLRAWLAVEVGFGVAAVLAVGVAPAESKSNFAWPIQPVVMAAVLGAFYMTTAPLFILPLFAKRWEMIRAMMLPAALFTFVQLIVTFLHWEKFSVGSTPFWVWFASYVLPPPILLAAYLWQERRAAGSVMPVTDPMPSGLHRLLIGTGGVFTLIGGVCFLVPSLLMANFPWKLTPLTTRSFCGWLILVGTMLLSIAREGDRTRARLATPMLLFVVPCLLLQLFRFKEEVQWGSPVLWLGLALFTLAGVAGLGIARGSWTAALR